MPNFNQPLVGIGLCVWKDNKVLLHKRKGYHAGGFWAFPGGHLEKYESFEDGALRELKEEAGDIKVTDPIFWTAVNTLYPDEGKHYVVIFMECNWVSDKPVITEPDKCEAYGWFALDALPEPLIQGLVILQEKGMLAFPKIPESQNGIHIRTTYGTHFIMKE